MIAIPPLWQTVLLLIASNVFMTFAWYGHLKNLADKPYMGRAFKLEFIWAGLCMVGALYFIFRP